MMVRTRPLIPPAACSESVDSRSLLSHPTDDPPLAPRFRPMPRLWTRKAFLSARRNDECAHIGTQMARFASLSAHGRRFGAHLGTLSSYAIPNPASRSGIRGKSASLGVSRPRHARPKIVSTISSTFSATINATTIMKITCLTVPSTHSPISSLVCV